MTEIKYVIKDEMGIHARPAGELIKACAAYPCKILICKDGKEMDAKRIMGVMALGVKSGEEITVNVEGDDEDTAATEIEAFFKATM